MNRVIERKDFLILSAESPQRHRTVFGFPITDNHQHRNFRETVFADLVQLDLYSYLII